MRTYLNPNAIKDASIDGKKIMAKSITSAQIGELNYATIDYVNSQIGNINTILENIINQ